MTGYYLLEELVVEEEALLDLAALLGGQVRNLERLVTRSGLLPAVDAHVNRF